jgi:hypothetical protein
MGLCPPVQRPAAALPACMCCSHGRTCSVVMRYVLPALPVSGPSGKKARRREAARLAQRQGAARRSGKTRPAVAPPRPYSCLAIYLLIRDTLTRSSVALLSARKNTSKANCQGGHSLSMGPAIDHESRGHPRSIQQHSTRCEGARPGRPAGAEDPLVQKHCKKRRADIRNAAGGANEMRWWSR